MSFVLKPNRTSKNVAYSLVSWFTDMIWIQLFARWDFENSYNTQLTLTCSKSTIRTLEKGAKNVQSQQ